MSTDAALRRIAPFLHAALSGPVCHHFLPFAEFQDFPGIETGVPEEGICSSDARLRVLPPEAFEKLRKPDGAVENTVVLEVDQARKVALHKSIDMIGNPASEGRFQHEPDGGRKASQKRLRCRVDEVLDIPFEAVEETAARFVADIVNLVQAIVPFAGPVRHPQ